MLTVLPYETYFGSKIPVDKIKTELFKYLSTTDTSALQYEFVTDSTIKLVFITGRNETEKERREYRNKYQVEYYQKKKGKLKKEYLDRYSSI